MPPFRMADVDALLADMGVDVTIGGNTVDGLLDQEDTLTPDPETGLQVIVRQTVCRIKTGALAGVASGVLVTVDGTSYRIRDKRLEGDGALTVLVLAAA
jgi:hypothetical protein